MSEERKNAVENLKNGNNESKSISGACKIVRLFWNNGYKEAFNYVGIKTAKQMENPMEVLAMFPEAMASKNEEGKTVVKIWKKKYFIKSQKNVNTTAKSSHTTNYIVFRKKRVFKWVQEEVTTWTPANLWTALEQAMTNNGAMPELPKESADYIATLAKEEEKNEKKNDLAKDLLAGANKEAAKEVVVA